MLMHFFSVDKQIPHGESSFQLFPTISPQGNCFIIRWMKRVLFKLCVKLFICSFISDEKSDIFSFFRFFFDKGSKLFSLLKKDYEIKTIVLLFLWKLHCFHYLCYVSWKHINSLLFTFNTVAENTFQHTKIVNYISAN